MLNLEPAHVEEELEEGEDGNVDVKARFIRWRHKLASHQTGQEERIHCQRHHLQGTSHHQSQQVYRHRQTDTHTVACPHMYISKTGHYIFNSQFDSFILTL